MQSAEPLNPVTLLLQAEFMLLEWSLQRGVNYFTGIIQSATVIVLGIWLSSVNLNHSYQLPFTFR